MSTAAQLNDWYLGLDIGTSSVGWAVTDEHYNIPRLRGKRAWGVRLFDEAQTAADRRLRRGARRRYYRRAERLKYLRQIFEPLITPIDPGFFQRMKDSFFWEDDKQEKQRNSLFNDADYTDKDYYRDFPTIFHLRKYLMDTKGKDSSGKRIDARHYYLACHHIIKYRGHFLFEGERDLDNSDTSKKFVELFSRLQDEINELFSFTFEEEFCIVLLELLSAKGTLSDRKNDTKNIDLIFEAQDDEEKCEEARKKAKVLREFLVGSSTDISKLIEIDKSKKIQLGKGDVDAAIAEITDEFGSQLEPILTLANELFNIGIARQIMGDAATLSEAYIRLYEQFGKVDPVTNKSELDTYNCSEKSERQIHKLASPRINEEGKEEKTIEKPKLRGYFKGAIPMQYNLSELRKIVSGLELAIPEFAVQKTVFKDDCTQINDNEKVLKLLTYRVPYYVGPLKTNQNEFETTKTDRQKPWMIRNEGKEQYKIYPWNFDLVVNKAASAAAFIQRMTNKCTYLSDEPCLPKDSVLYQKYLVLNELNKMKIDGKAIDVQTKQALYTELFLTTTHITLKTIKDWCASKGFSTNVSIADSEGIGGTINHKMKSYLLFKKDLDKQADVLLPKIEKAIQYITLLPDDKEMLEEQLGELFKNEDLDNRTIKQIARYSFSKWGQFSEKLLCGLTENVDGFDRSIIDLLWETNDNFMEIYHKYFENQIRTYQEAMSTKTDDDVFIDESYASVPVKRSARQAVRVIRELEKLIGRPPKKVFIEAPRSKEDSVRTVNRKKQLETLYKGIKSDVAEQLKEYENQDLKPKRIYLYFLQHGKCAYSGKPLNIDALSEECQIDHIVPQSLLKDDSFDNLVLVKKEYNQIKGDQYPFNSVEGIAFDMQLALWRSWHKQGLVSDKKLKSLSRTSLSIDEIAGFINRQLVETSQTTKMVMDILKRVMPQTQVVYQKAETVSEFKREWIEYEGVFEGPTDNKRFVPSKDESGKNIVKRIIKPRFIKIREMNDLHHAKDAYLNIVVGNVYASKFTNNPREWIMRQASKSFTTKRKWNIAKVMYDEKSHDIPQIADPFTGELVWDEEHLETVTKTMARNDILVTVRTYIKAGRIFDETIHKADKKYFPVKKKFEGRTDRYGGYTGNYTAYFAYLMDNRGKKRFAAVPVRYCDNPLGYLMNEYPDATVLIEQIPIKSHLIVNGHHVILNGNSGTNMLVGQFKQLLLKEEEIEYLQKLLKAHTKRVNDKKYVLTQADGVSSEGNSALYQCFLAIAQQAYSTRPNTKGVLEFLCEKQKDFSELGINDQVFVLNEMLNMFRYVPKSASEVNCKLLGGNEHSGGTSFSAYERDVKLVVESTTGLYSHILDLSIL